MVEVVVIVVVVIFVVVVHFVDIGSEVTELCPDTDGIEPKANLSVPWKYISLLVSLVNLIDELFLSIAIFKLALRPTELRSKKFIKSPSVLFASTVKYAIAVEDSSVKSSPTLNILFPEASQSFVSLVAVDGNVRLAPSTSVEVEVVVVVVLTLVVCPTIV